MAKQSGIHGLRGKVNGMSYYSSKNGGQLVRKINEGLGQRVKDAKEYINTRKNNAEFGMCGDFAGAIIKPFSLRWRFILDSIATGKMVKTMKELVQLDNSGSWGQRVIKPAYYSRVRAAFNSFSKNEMIPEIQSLLSLGVTFDAQEGTIDVSAVSNLSQESIQELLDLGANYFYAKYYALVCSVPQFDGGTNSYAKAESYLEELTDFNTADEIAAGSEVPFIGSASTDLSENPIDGATELGAFVVVFLPARKVGQSISILQQHCSAYMVPVTPAE